MPPKIKQFQSPSHGLAYYRDVTQRCEDMIYTKIWDGLDPTRLRSWLTNFESTEEKYFAAKLLDTLVYRSANQTRAIMYYLFETVLPSSLNDLRQYANVSWTDLLAGTDDPEVRIVPVINVADPPTKSGPHVCRLLKRHLGLNERWMIWPSQVQQAEKQGVRLFLLVDDFVGTGYQFRKFFNGIEHTNSVFVYLSLVSYEKGLSKLETRFPELRLAPGELLDDSHNIFSVHSTVFNDDVNDQAIARNFYLALLKKKSINWDQRFALGYSRLSLAFAFDHATPNSTLPIFWANAGSLKPLFIR